MVTVLSRTFSTQEDYYGECEYALIELNDELLKVILRRRKAFLKAKEEEQDLFEMYFWGANEAIYLSANDFSPTPVDEKELFGGKEYIPFEGGTEKFVNLAQRTECDQMIIDDSGVQWTTIPKHTDMYITTPHILFEQIEKWIGKEKSDGS